MGEHETKSRKVCYLKQIIAIANVLVLLTGIFSWLLFVQHIYDEYYEQ